MSHLLLVLSCCKSVRNRSQLHASTILFYSPYTFFCGLHCCTCSFCIYFCCNAGEIHLYRKWRGSGRSKMKGCGVVVNGYVAKKKYIKKKAENSKRESPKNTLVNIWCSKLMNEFRNDLFAARCEL